MAASMRMSGSRSSPKKKPVVIDLGSAFIKCGFAGDARPVHIIPSIIGRALDRGHGPGLALGQRMTNEAAGVVPSWGAGGAAVTTKEEWTELLTDVLCRLYTESLQCRPKERRVIVCESMVCPRPLREAVAHILFRFLQIPALHICAGPAPTLYCTGLDTGMVVDIGSREAHVMAVYRGSPVLGSYIGVPLGFRAVQERLGELLAENEGEQGAAAKNDQEGAKDQERGQNERGRALTWQELEEVVVRACLVPVGGVPSAEQVSPMEFVFSGRRKVIASGTVRATAAQEALFEGDGEGRTLATLVLDCLERCPRDCRRALAQNVVVAGGGALLPGLCARLGEEITALARGSGGGGSGGGGSTGGSRGDSESGIKGVVGVGKPEGYGWARSAVFGEGGSDRGGGGGDSGSVSGGAGGGDSDGGGRGGGGDSGSSSVGGGGGRGGLCVVKVPVRRDVLLWTGMSIIGCLGGVAERSLTIEQYHAREREGARLPDWMSVSPSDWLFEAAPVAAV